METLADCEPMARRLQEQLGEHKRKVDFDTFDISVRELISMVADDLIDIAPEYQRHFRWSDHGQSTFVESVFLGIPIPSLFMAANPNGQWELIDGVQRLSTIIRFAGDDTVRAKIGRSALTLTGLRKLTEFNGFTFDDLPSTVQVQFTLKPLKVTTISDKSDMHVRFDLFERLNTGGVSLTPQEIRACIYQGSFNDFLRTMAANEAYKKTVRLRDSDERNATREELVLRFFAFLNKYQRFEHSVIDFLNDYMEEASSDFDYETGRSLFERTFDELRKVLPRGITRGNRRQTPVNLFEGVAVGAALALQQRESLVTDGIREWMRSPALTYYTTGATNSRKMVAGRIEFCRDKFLGIDAS